MSEVYLKKANKNPETGTSETREIVEKMLSDIENGGEEVATKYSKSPTELSKSRAEIEVGNAS